MKPDIEKISKGIDKLIGEAEALLQSLADGADGKIEAGQEKSQAALQRVCGHLRNARSEVVEGARKIDGAVRSHPWEAMAATAILGFLTGLLVRRR